MGKLRRGALWLTFWPAGAVASVRAGRRRDTDRIVGAIHDAHDADAQEPTVEQLAFRTDLERRLEEAGPARPRRLLALFRAGWSGPPKR